MATSQIRRRQPTSSGHGKHFTSPARKDYRKKSGSKVYIRDHTGRYPGLHARLLQLRNSVDHPPLEDDVAPSNEDDIEGDLSYQDDIRDMDYDEEPQGSEPLLDPSPPLPCPPTPDHIKTKRRILPNTADFNEYRHWQENVEQMVDAYLSYTNRTLGKPVERSEVILRQDCDCNEFKESSITCLYYDHFRKLQVPYCVCQPLHEVLVLHGLFPSAPQQPKVAVSLELLGLYRAMFERSCDAGQRILDPYRRSLTSAIQWHDTLQIEVQLRLDTVLVSCNSILKDYRASQLRYGGDTAVADITGIASDEAASATEPAALQPVLCNEGVTVLATGQPGLAEIQTTGEPALVRGEADRQLQKLCPACFGGSRWGRHLDEGGDVHMALDGNFHHRHQASSSDGPHFHDAHQIIPKDQVDAVGNRIDAARKRPARKFRPKVPEEVIQECQDSHTAADGRKAKTDMGHFDDTGLMAMVCRHDVPLFVANIDTPGEQQKYGVALMEHVLTLLPPQATCMFIIDVGCVFDVSLNKYEIIADDALNRIKFCTSAMHAYAHQWSCQLKYNPRLQKGMGLSDGEGVERLWSRIRRLIGVTRTMGRRRRLWIIDRFLASVAQDHREELGQWIRHKLDGEKGIKKETARAEKVVEACAVEEDVLRKEWEDQVETQTSIRAHAPARLKKEVDAVLSLQTEIGSLEKTIEDTRGNLSHLGASAKDVKASLNALTQCQAGLYTQVERLYASLNVQDKFPELAGVDVEFVRTLLLARDMKTNIRKRAIGSFMEWERLDQAAGGKHQALGTKIHQKTRQAITKRTPALLRSIRTFNKYCAKLSDLHDPSWLIPVPDPLPTNLSHLRDDSSLMEDVWIARTNERVPRWLDDSDVRNGIRALMKRDRCREERCRLGIEGDNMCAQLSRELSEVELAILMPEHHALHPLLLEHRTQLRLLQPQWTSVLQSNVRIQSAIANAADAAIHILGIQPSIDLNWVPTVIAESPELVYHDITIDDPSVIASQESLVEDSEGVMAEDALEDEIDGLLDSNSMVEAATAEVVWKLPVQYLIEDPIDISEDAPNVAVPVKILHRALAASGPRSRVSYETSDIARFVSPTALLNDECINGAALLLQSHFIHEFGGSDVAILSTHDLVRVRYGVSDDDLWRNTKRSQYWAKSAWLLPIHHKDDHHWVLCAIYPSKKQLHLIDSFGERRGWLPDVKDIMKLVARLSVIASAKGHITPQDDFCSWKASPLIIRSVQTNAYDCGVWTLAGIWAVLRGFEVTSHTEMTISRI
ncbi:hypothetical protein HWV62_34613 [Athelia sp. TMB]|nr:hypothetical protein HWV62_34613 [Athelia sp. TMB]